MLKNNQVLATHKCNLENLLVINFEQSTKYKFQKYIINSKLNKTYYK